MCSTVTRLQQAEYFPGATPSKFQGILYSPWMLGRFLRSRKLFLTCVPVLEWTVSLLKWMASAVQWPERWIHSYSGTAELISHSHEGLRGSLFLYLGVKKEEQEKQKGERRGSGGGEEEGKKKYRREKRRGNTRRKRRKDAQLKMPCPEDPRYSLPFPLLSVVFHFQVPPTTPHGCTHSRQSLEMPSQPPCLLVTLTSSQLASQWFSDRNCDGTRSDLACYKQIKLLKIRWEAVW